MAIPRNVRPVHCKLNPCFPTNTIGKAWKVKYRIPRISAFLLRRQLRIAMRRFSCE